MSLLLEHHRGFGRGPPLTLDHTHVTFSGKAHRSLPHGFFLTLAMANLSKRTVRMTGVYIFIYSTIQSREIYIYIYVIEGLNWVEESAGGLLTKQTDLHIFCLKESCFKSRFIQFDSVSCQDAFEAVLTNMTVCGIIYWRGWMRPIVDSWESDAFGWRPARFKQLKDGERSLRLLIIATGRAAINPKTWQALAYR